MSTDTLGIEVSEDKKDTSGHTREHPEVLIEEPLSYIINKDNTDSDRFKVFYELRKVVMQEELKSIHRIIFKLINNTVEIRNIIPTKEQFFTILEANIDKIVFDKEIDINQIASQGGYPLNLDNPRDVALAKNMVYSAVQNKWDTLEQTSVNFEVSMGSILALSDTYLKLKLNKVLRDMNQIFFEGTQINREYLAGNDVIEYGIRELSALRDTHLLNEEEDKLLVIDNIEQLNKLKSDSNRNKKKVFDWDLQPIDEAFGPLYTGNTVSLLGQEGVGKSRYSYSRVVEALTTNKCNVYVWTGEMTKDLVTDILICRHAYKEGYYIEDRWVQNGELTEEQNEIYENMKISLVSKEDHGTLAIEDGTMTPQGIVPRVRYINKYVMPIDLIVIDHMGLLEISKVEHFEVQEAYKALHTFGKDMNIAVIFLNHIKSNALDRILEGGDAQTNDSAKTQEAVRTPDYIITMTQTPQQKEVAKVKFETQKSRLGEWFAPFLADTLAGVCEFNYTE